MEYLFAISEQLSAVPWMVLCVRACHGHLRWSQRAATIFCLGFSAWLVLCGVLCVELRLASSLLLLPSVTVAGVLLVRASRYGWQQTAWVVSTAAYLGSFVCYMAVIIDAYAVGDQLSTMRLAWPGMAVQWGLDLVFILLLWGPAGQMVPLVLGEYQIDEFWRRAWLYPAFNAVVVIFAAPDDISYLLVGRVGGLAALCLVVQLALVVLTYVQAARLIRQSRQRVQGMEENRQLSVALQQAIHQQERVEDARRARHDLRHHLHALRDLMTAGEYDRALAYLGELEPEGVAAAPLSYCQNEVVNSVVSYYLARAAATGARVDARLEVPRDLGARETEVVVVMGNVLENAARALERDQREGLAPERGAFVTVRSRLVNGSTLVFTCDNSCCLPPQADGEGGFSSLAPDGSGLGLPSVRAVAERSGGSAQFSYLDGTFTSSIALQLV